MSTVPALDRKCGTPDANQNSTWCKAMLHTQAVFSVDDHWDDTEYVPWGWFLSLEVLAELAQVDNRMETCDAQVTSCPGMTAS